MIIEAAAAACEIVIGLAAVVADVAVLIFVASIRPWRYMLSPAFRSSEKARLRNRGVLFKAVYFGWGSIALLASIGLIVAATWIVSDWHARQVAPRAERQRAVDAVKERASELRERLRR